MQEMASAFEDDMTEALIPFVDSHFRTVADRDHRAMAGLSMGGMQTFQVTFDHLELFSYIGGFSGAAGPMVLGNRSLDVKTTFTGSLRSWQLLPSVCTCCGWGLVRMSRR